MQVSYKTKDCDVITFDAKRIYSGKLTDDTLYIYAESSINKKEAERDYVRIHIKMVFNTGDIPVEIKDMVANKITDYILYYISSYDRSTIILNNLIKYNLDNMTSDFNALGWYGLKVKIAVINEEIA